MSPEAAGAVAGAATVPGADPNEPGNGVLRSCGRGCDDEDSGRGADADAETANLEDTKDGCEGDGDADKDEDDEDAEDADDDDGSDEVADADAVPAFIADSAISAIIGEGRCMYTAPAGSPGRRPGGMPRPDCA